MAAILEYIYLTEVLPHDWSFGRPSGVMVEV